jgi:hypothetical protein
MESDNNGLTARYRVELRRISEQKRRGLMTDYEVLNAQIAAAIQNYTDTRRSSDPEPEVVMKCITRLNPAQVER